MKKNNIVIPMIASLCLIGGMASTVSCSNNGPVEEPAKPIEMGMYPQARVSKISQESLYESLTGLVGDMPLIENLNGWNTFDDYYVDGFQLEKYYKDVELDDLKYRAICFGDDPIENLSFFKYEPIKWKVLTDDGLVVSESILDRHMYNHDLKNDESGSETIYKNNYEHSDIRKFINGNFMDFAFTSAEASKILTTEVDNSLKSTETKNDKYICNNTNDKLFLLSMNDLKNSDYGFGNQEERAAVLTDYAQVVGACKSEKHGVYWTRSPIDNDDENVQCVIKSGYTFDYNSRSFNVGVRPALRIKK